MAMTETTPNPQVPNPPMHPTLAEAVSPVIARIPSGVFIITLADGAGRETGLLASWVQQAAFDPPMITVAINRKRYAHEWLERHPYLAAHVVGESQKFLLKQFGRGFGPDEPAFEGQAIRRNAHGVPLLEAALGTLEGRVVGSIETGDHVVYAVELTAAHAGPSFADEGPMVHIRKNGMNY